MKNINIFQLIAVSALAMLLVSCEDVIDVNLANAEPQTVIDAWLTDIPGATQTIVVSETQSYFDSIQATGLTGAEITLTAGDKQIVFSDAGNGNYTWTPDSNESLSTYANTYELKISYDNVDYTSSATIGRVPEIDEIRQEKRENELGAVDGGIYLEFIARDLEGLGDSYWIKTYKNGAYLNKASEINLAFDAGFTAGSQSDGLIFIPPIRELTNPMPDEDAEEESPWAVGDTCRVEIHSISNQAFRFMEVVRDQILNGTNGIFAEPLANAQGNISASNDKEALGVFNIAKVSSLEYIVE